MAAPTTPMRWPDAWKDPAALDLLRGTTVDCLFIGPGEDLAEVRARASHLGLQLPATDALAAVEIVKGVWPGVKMGRSGGGSSAGPTGVPWVDSNGWLIRLTRALHPEVSVWVDAPPAAKTFITADSYLIAIADSAAYGGNWIVSLDDPLTLALAARRPEALATWKKLTAAAAFFAAHQDWRSYVPLAVVGVVSDFAEENEFFSRELLNLLARAGQHYRILPKDKVSASSFDTLRAVIYPDVQAPSPTLRKHVLTFVEAGGMLIAGPQWGAAPGAPARPDRSERYSWRVYGKGKIALANAEPDDPYLWANESVVMVSHRYDLVRFWNGGAAGAYCTMAPGGRCAVVHLLFYAFRGPDSATVRIAGRYRSARAFTVDQPEVPNLVVEQQTGAVEVHLPPVSQYVALHLEV